MPPLNFITPRLKSDCSGFLQKLITAFSLQALNTFINTCISKGHKTAGIYFFKNSDGNIRTMFGTCSKLIMKIRDLPWFILVSFWAMEKIWRWSLKSDSIRTIQDLFVWLPLLRFLKDQPFSMYIQTFLETNISNPLMGFRNVSFLENFAYVLNGWSLN